MFSAQVLPPHDPAPPDGPWTPVGATLFRLFSLHFFLDKNTWGSFVFNVSPTKILTFHSFTRKASYKTEPGEDGKNKPKTINKSPDLGTISMTVQLIPEFGVDVHAVSEEWLAACDAGTPYPMTIGGKVIGKGKWQLKDVTLNNTVFGKDGVLVRADMVINFIEYTAAGSAKSTSSSTKKPPKTNQSKPSETVKPATTQSVKPTQAYGIYNNLTGPTSEVK